MAKLAAETGNQQKEQAEDDAEEDRRPEGEVNSSVAAAPGEVARKTAERNAGFTEQGQAGADGKQTDAEEHEDAAHTDRLPRAAGMDYGSRNRMQLPQFGIVCTMLGNCVANCCRSDRKGSASPGSTA